MPGCLHSDNAVINLAALLEPLSRDPPSSAIITLVQGVGDILRDEDTTYGDADEDVNMMLNEQAAEDAMDSAIEHFDARVLNKTAGIALPPGFPVVGQLATGYIHIVFIEPNRHALNLT